MLNDNLTRSFGRISWGIGRRRQSRHRQRWYYAAGSRALSNHGRAVRKVVYVLPRRYPLPGLREGNEERRPGPTNLGFDTFVRYQTDKLGAVVRQLPNVAE